MFKSTGVLALGMVLAGLYWAYRRVKEWLIWRDPIDSISYLLPKADYPLRHFSGGPAEEVLRPALRVRFGEYLIPIEFWVKAEMPVDEVVWSFSDTHSAVTDLGETNPFMLEPQQIPDGSIRYRDWWGSWRKKPAEVVYQPNVTWIMFHRVVANKPYNGNLEIAFRIRGHSPTIKRLPFAVSADGPDDIPYLRADRASPDSDQEVH